MNRLERRATARLSERVRKAYLLVLAGAMLLSQANAQTVKPVPTESGDLVGTTSNGVRIFLGVPFAAPPIGPLRWKPPQPVVKSTAPLAADKLGSACMQVLSRNKLPWTEEFMVQNDASED